MKKSLFLAPLLLLSACENFEDWMTTGRAAPYRGPSAYEAMNRPEWSRPKVAVVSFENRAGIAGVANLGDGLADMFQAEIQQSNAFNVYDRQNVAAILREQDLATEGRVKPGSGVPTGQMESPDYLIRGAVTDFKYDIYSATGGVGFKGTGVDAQYRQAYMELQVTVIDARTSRVVMTPRGTGRAHNPGIGLGHDGKDVDFHAAFSHNAPLGLAARQSMQQIIAQLAQQLPPGPGQAPPQNPQGWQNPQGGWQNPPPQNPQNPPPWQNPPPQYPQNPQNPQNPQYPPPTPQNPPPQY